MKSPRESLLKMPASDACPTPPPTSLRKLFLRYSRPHAHLLPHFLDHRPLLASPPIPRTRATAMGAIILSPQLRTPSGG